jgi:RND family efflux transporter MFP subunit
MRWRARSWIWLLAIAVVTGGGAWWFSGRGDASVAADWIDVKREDLILGVEVSGTLAAVESSQLTPPQIPETWNFKISMLAPEGAQVTSGQPVMGFDASDLERKLEQKLAESASAGKQLERTQADITLRRNQEALRLAEAEGRLGKAELKVDRPGELASAAELAQARLDLDLARQEIDFMKKQQAAAIEADRAQISALVAQRDRAEQRVKEIRDAIERMTVKAPRDGTVIYVTNWREEKKKVGDSVWRAERILEIPDLRKMNAKGEVAEAAFGEIAERQRVTLRLDAHPDIEFSGRVASIWKTVQRKSWQDPQRVVRLEINLDSTDTMRMRPGMRFRGTIETDRVPRALVVPAEAVFPTSDGPVVYCKTPMGYERITVTLGRRNDKLVEIREGLSEGDRVARRDLAVLRRAA